MKISSAWPNKAQLTLLKAALLPPDQAERYWHEFIAAYDLRNIDHGCSQVLPMVFINLKDRMKIDINEKICRSSYKYVWANNNVLMHDAKMLLILLKENHIDVCLLKGAAFIGHYYADYGMRILGDIDLLVPPKQMLTLVEVLESNQYKVKSNQGEADARGLLRILHAKSFVNCRGTDFDVHQYLSPSLIDAELSDRIWKNKRSIDLFGNKNLTYVLSPTYQLLHTVLHGLQYAPVSSVRWIVDATNLLNNSVVDIDWNELIDVCSRHHLNLPMSQALRFLSEEIDIPIPGKVILHFNNIRITKKDKKYYAISSNLGFQPTIERINRSWEHYKAYSCDKTKKIDIFGFYDFLLIYLDIKSRWMLGPHIAVKASGVIIRSIRMLFRNIFFNKRLSDEKENISY